MGFSCLNTYNGLIDDFEIFKGINSEVINEKAQNAPVLTYSPSNLCF